MRCYVNPSRKIWEKLCRRPSSGNAGIRVSVTRIISRVKKGGDAALKEIEAELSGFAPECFEVPAAEIAAAAGLVSPAVKAAIEQAAANITAFHKAQMPKEIKLRTAPGVKCMQRPVPIGKVGLYIPGGTAPLFSTVLMLGIPARIAGCSDVILCTPARSAEVLYAASVCGITRIFRIGGAQAIAAMAYGTQSIPKVDKIFGPGNQYVTTAKQMLGGRVVSIDMPAGPSEVMVIADSSTNPAFAAADLLSQAEHGRDSQVVLVTDGICTEAAIRAEVDRQVAELGRGGIATEALGKSLSVVFLDDDDDNDLMVDFANAYAPEHLIVSTWKPWEIVDRITTAGSVFVGKYTPESAGDYASGTNHTLPTCAWGRSCSGVNIDSFMRKMTIQEISREGLKGLADTIVSMAEAEGLQAHANAVKVRTK